jgi:hypothetical protein
MDQGPRLALGKNVRPYPERLQNYSKRAEGMAQVVLYLPS